MRLQNIPMLQPPQGYEEPDSHTYFLQDMHRELTRNRGLGIHPDVIERIEGAQYRLENPEPWMVLATEEQPQVWKTLITESMEGLDAQAIGWLRDLGYTQGKYGTIETIRIIHHIFKDRRASKKPTSGWLIKTCQEAFEALRNMQAWEGNPKGQGKGQDPSSSSGYVTGLR